MIGIYKVENLITHQCYIGQSKFIEKRWQDHKRAYKTGTSKFYKALKEYGIQNFSWEVIETCSQEKLDEREIYWINYYNSYLQGYNSTLGGQSQSTLLIENIHKAWDEGLSNKQIAEKFNIGTTLVYEILKTYDKYSSHEAKIRGGILSRNTLLKSNDKKYIYQYELNGKYLNTWNSTKEIQRTLNIESSSIGKVLNNKRNSAGGFIWSYNKYEIFPLSKNNNKYSNKPVKVKKYDLNDNFIKEYESYSAAARDVKGDLSFIRRVTNHPTKTAYGFKWRN